MGKMTKPVGIIAMGGYVPAKPIDKQQKEKLVAYLRQNAITQPEYIACIEEKSCWPGRIETNYDGWESQPWFEAWVQRLPAHKQSNPFQGCVERRRVPLDPISVRASIIPHPMLPSDAETLAGAQAIVNAGIAPDDIDLVMAHSQVPDFPLPQNTSLLQHKLGLRKAGAYGVDTCCSSFVTMIELATSLIATGIKKNILIISSYLDSHTNDKSTYFSVDTGDAAVAAVVSAVEPDYGYISSHSTSHGSRHDGIIFERRSPQLLKKTGLGPNYEQEFTTFYNQKACKEIAANAKDDLAYVVRMALEKAQLTIAEVDFFVTHQPVAWAGNAWREAIGIPPHKFYHSFEKYGNIATASAAINLLEAIEQRLIKTDDTVLIASSGAGENHIAILMKASHMLIRNNEIL